MNSESIIKTNNNLKKEKNENQANVNINTYNDEKTIFSKIAEDLFVVNMDNLREKKNIFGITKLKDDNYNKLTVKNYLFTSADKENSKNGKIINEFMKRKKKEQKYKKLGKISDKIGTNSNFGTFKMLLSSHQKK